MTLQDKRFAYLMGIGGIGMANVAALLCEAEWNITGSDNAIYPPASELLNRLPVSLKTPYSAENLPKEGPIIVGNALSRGHVEVEEALNKNLEIFSFPEFLRNFILNGKNRIVVAGTHGKTTTAACIAFLLENLGLHSSFLVGGQPRDFPFGGHSDSGDWFVLEGDEYDSAFFDKRSKFLHYFPHVLVLGRIEFDHADIFSSLEDIEKSFRLLLRQVPENGLVVAFGDHGTTRRIAENAPCRVVWVGEGEENDWRLLPGTDELCWTAKDRGEGGVRWKLFGQHNRLNALMSLATLVELGFDTGVVVNAISRFSGVRRRLELLLETENLTVLDDFAHHPTAIAAAIQAVRERQPNNRIVAVFEPRSNTTVRNYFQNELAEAFLRADDVVLGTIHRADKIPEAQRLNTDVLAQSIRRKNLSFIHLPNEEIPEWLKAHLTDEPTTILFMSNGSFSNVQSRFLDIYKKD